MKVLWLSPCIPEVKDGKVIPSKMTGGWIFAMLQGLRKVDPTLELVVLGYGIKRIEYVLDGIRFMTYGMRPPKVGFLPDRNIAERIKSVVATERPDIVHMQGTEHFYAACEPSVFCGRPVVVSLQGLISELHIHMTGGLSWRETMGSHLNARLLRYGATIFGDQTLWRERRAKLEVHALQSFCHFIGRTAFDESIVRAYNPSAQYYRVDETLRSPFYDRPRTRNGIRRHSIYCGGAAAYPLKGIHWLFRSIAILRTRYPDIMLRVAASERLDVKRALSFSAWLRTDAYGLYLRKLIRELGIEDNVVFLPPLDAESVADELRHAELFALPSLCENSSNSIGEAMLMRTPVVACYTGGIPSIVRNGIDGILVPPYDSFQLAAAIRVCFDDPDAADARADNAAVVACERHDPVRDAQALVEVYRQMLAS